MPNTSLMKLHKEHTDFSSECFYPNKFIPDTIQLKIDSQNVHKVK